MYNPYNPYGYMFQGQQMPQQMNFNPQSVNMAPPIQTPQNPQQSQQTGPDWLQVPDIQQVEQVQVQPGGKAWIMVQNNPVFALRVADQMGLVKTDYYKFEKIDPSTINAPDQKDEYVTRAEFQQFVESLNASNRRPIKKEAAE